MKHLTLFIAFAIMFCSNLQSQNILPAQRVDMILETSPSDNSVSTNDTMFSSTTQVVAKLIIVLQDTINISKINIKLGTTSSNYNLLNKSFLFDVNGTLADGTSYQRVGSVVYLTLGTFAGLQNAYSEVKLQDTFARLTDPIVVSGN